MEVFAFPVSTLVPFRVAHPTPGQQPRTQCTSGRDHRPASLLSLLHEHGTVATRASQFYGALEREEKKDEIEEGEGKYGNEVEKEEEHADMTGNRRSEEFLGIGRQNEEPLGRGLGQEQGGLVQNLTALLCAKTLKLGYSLENEHPPHPWARGPGGVETWSGARGKRVKVSPSQKAMGEVSQWVLLFALF